VADKKKQEIVFIPEDGDEEYSVVPEGEYEGETFQELEDDPGFNEFIQTEFSTPEQIQELIEEQGRVVMLAQHRFNWLVALKGRLLSYEDPDTEGH
jgi:hypothetical protein